MKIVEEVLERALREYLEEDEKSQDYYIRQRNFEIIERFINKKANEIQEKLMEVGL